MLLKNGSATTYTRYYFSNKYETEQTVAGTKEILYLCGDAYTAPAVFVKNANTTSWKLYFIGRDYLGSITHILTEQGVVQQELSYDAWGRLRDPQTLQVYARGNEPELFLGRGYTGHEHLSPCGGVGGGFGLINMNARLYDPLLGRFLSPDPYIQDPYNPHNYNRYAYCLNNPFKYTDPNGENPLLIAAGIYVLFFTDFGYQLQKYVSPVAIHIDLKYGTHQKGAGIDVSLGIPKLIPYAPRAEYGATYYWKNYGDYKGWETRQGKETTYFWLYTEGETKYKSGIFSQTVGYKKIGIPGVVGVDIYNDLWGDGGDRFRTSRVRLNFFIFGLENVLFTGDPGMDERYEKEIEKCGPNKTYIQKQGDPYAPDPDKYRHGVLSLSIGPFSIGYDSENIRYVIQNLIVHNLTDSNYFKYMREKKGQWYFQFGGW